MPKKNLEIQEKKPFNQSKYIQDYIKSHKKKFSTDLSIDIFNEIDTFLKKNDISKADFVRKSYSLLKNDKNIFDKFMNL